MAYYNEAHKLKLKVYEMQSGICSICNKKVLFKKSHLHHKDGDIKNNCIGNLTILHNSCHTKLHCKGKKYKRRNNTKIEKKLGITYEYLKSNNIPTTSNYLNEICKWEEIKDKLGAKYLGCGVGRIYQSRVIKQTGFTGKEIADYAGFTSQYVNQLLNENNPKLWEIVGEMRNKN
jgi:hypothetical protein